MKVKIVKATRNPILSNIYEETVGYVDLSNFDILNLPTAIYGVNIYNMLTDIGKMRILSIEPKYDTLLYNVYVLTDTELEYMKYRKEIQPQFISKVKEQMNNTSKWGKRIINKNTYNKLANNIGPKIAKYGNMVNDIRKYVNDVIDTQKGGC